MVHMSDCERLRVKILRDYENLGKEGIMDSRNLLIYAMIMEFNGILNLTPRKVGLQLLVVTPLLCPSNWATLP